MKELFICEKDMPKSCAECEFINSCFKNFEIILLDKRKSDCPLHSITEIEAETKALKERWEKLKGFISSEMDYDRKQSMKDDSENWESYLIAEENIFNKMYEFEQEGGDE